MIQKRQEGSDILSGISPSEPLADQGHLAPNLHGRFKQYSSQIHVELPQKLNFVIITQRLEDFFEFFARNQKDLYSWSNHFHHLRYHLLFALEVSVLWWSLRSRINTGQTQTCEYSRQLSWNVPPKKTTEDRNNYWEYGFIFVSGMFNVNGPENINCLKNEVSSPSFV